jgi:CheY-like chemotaxis protein
VSERIRILLVDDEQLILKSLRRLLSRGPFDVAVASSGPEALAYLEQNTVDVIVSDYKMPGMTGIEFLREAAPRWPDVRRCMLTAQADNDILEEALRDGLLHRAFKKPWDNRALVEALQSVT